MPPTRPDRNPRPAQPPRPPNAWILYRSDKLRELASNQPPGPRKPQAEISKIISQMWSSEGPETKGRYEARAEEKKAEHAALYPDYKFAPMKKEDKALLRKAQRQEKEEAKQQARRQRPRKGGKGRDEDDEDEAPRPFVSGPSQLPYPLSANTTPTQHLQQPRPAQSWYPPSTYGPQHPHSNTSPQPQPHRIPPPPLPSHLQSSSGAYAAAGWSAPVDPSQQDQPFSVNAYRQSDDQDEDEWAGEEGEVGAEEAWHDRTRRNAVWADNQPQQHLRYPSYDSYPPNEYQHEYPQQQQQDWVQSTTPPPPAQHAPQPPLLTIAVPATLNPSDTDPYTFSLDFDMPMAAYTADPDAHVALSFASVNLEEEPTTSSTGTGLLGDVPGLNEILSAPLPDIEVAFPDFQEGQEGFDVLSTDNEEWWQALMHAALPPPAPQQAPELHAVAGSSSPERAFKGQDSDVMLSGSRRPAPVHAHTMPVQASSHGQSSSHPQPSSFSHGLPSPEPFVPVESFDEHQQQRGRPRASSSAYPYASTSNADYSHPQQPHPQQYEQAYIPPREDPVHPSPFAQIAARAPAQARRGAWVAPPAPAPVPAPRKIQQQRQFPSPSGAAAFPSPTGAAAFPSPSGAMPTQQPRGFPYAAAPPPRYPPPPFFAGKKPSEKEKEKDSEAFDFSGWGNQYGAQPPTPAEDTVRRGCMPAVTN
ncbi:HMG (high mobility group) box protein [Ceratobasidium sp. AG-Ba]|nr:HMG (high mobility group) box protein [Ceratobasidium sp. AG-Ba]